MTPLVSVIIPVYNKGATVRRTIESVKNQSLRDIEIVVVNDGSTDNSEEQIRAAIKGDSRCTYLHQDNVGVAHARNRGVLDISTGRFIVCLDSDDAIESDYLSHLVAPMIEDNSLSITYTKLRYIKPDGEQGVSKWPDEFSADDQMAGRNQIPTAAMVRRRVWERLGGQRQRFSPVGAGAEDADFWLRAVSYGFKARFIPVKQGTYFVYSFLSGLVSGNRDYNEPNYRLWSPWTENVELMPTPSLATAVRGSHPARQYDEPLVSIIVPVGPGHAHHLVNALDSLDAQTFKRWEAIVVFDISKEEWRNLFGRGLLTYIARTWPFCRFASTASGEKLARELVDTLDVAEGIDLLDGLPAVEAPRGAGMARNVGINLARAPLLMFLDADDWLVPTALRVMLDAYKEHGHIIYSDHIAVAKIAEEDLGKVDGKVVGFDRRSGDAFIEQSVANYNCPKAMEQPYTDGRPPYVICNVSALVPRKWAVDIGGFSEKMKSWEDVLFFWRLAWEGYCFTRVPQPLLVYRYYTGRRRELGRKHAPPLLKYLSEVSENMAKKGCGCGGAKSPTIINTAANTAADESNIMSRIRLSRGIMLDVTDADLVMVEFNPPDAGDKTRYGLHDFGGGNVIVYGRYDKGASLYAHRKDIEADQKIASSQGREPMFLITGPSRDEIAVEHEVEELAPPPEIAEWLEPTSVSKPVPSDSPLNIMTHGTPTLFGQVDVSEKPVDADEYFPPRSESKGRLTYIYELDVEDIKSPDRYLAIMRSSNIETAWDILEYERKFPAKGIGRLDGIGPKVRKAFVDAAGKVI